MAVAGALIGGAIGAFGKKPQIPGLPPINPDDIQNQTIAGNAGSLSGAQALASRVDQFNFDQLAKALEFWSPGSLEKLQGSIGAQLSGILDPADTQSLIRSSTAAGYGKGFNFGAGGIGRNLVLRDLGIGVQQQKQMGLQNLLGVYGAGPKPFDVTSMFFTPVQRLNFAMEDRMQRYQRDLLANQVEAAPDPATAALGREIDRFFNTAASFGMMAAGGAMGGGGGGMGGGLGSFNGGGGMNAGGYSGGGVTGGWNPNWLNAQSMAGSANGATV